MSVRVGIGHDTHRLVPGRPLILGGVQIAHDLGLQGHSDADVVLHALADALLGAAGLGDIGEHFPDTEPRWEGIEGGRLVALVMDLLHNAGWSPSNCDIIIHAERPKLLPYKSTMRERIAELLALDTAAVNIKAKTGEGVDAVGRSEAMSAQAVVLIRALTRPTGSALESASDYSSGDSQRAGGLM